MKRFFSVAALLALVVSMTFAGGRQTAGSAGTADGLSVVKAFGVNRTAAYDGRNVSFSDWYEGKVPSRLWERLVADLAQRGLKLEVEAVMSDQIATVFQTMLASGKLNDYDFVTMGWGDEQIMQGLYTQGRMYALNKGIEEYSTGNARNYYFNNDAGIFFRKTATFDDGNFYWITQIGEASYKGQKISMGFAATGNIRYDWLQTLGLKIPATLEEFTNTLIAFQQNDMNKNGIKDEVASVSLENFTTGVAQWFGLGTGLVSAVDYKTISPWYQPRVQDYIRYMNQLYKAGLLYVDSEGGAMEANRVAYQYQWAVANWDEPQINIPPGAARAYYVPFVIKVLPDTEPLVYEQNGYYRVFNPHFIPARAKNVEGAIKLIDYLVTDEYATLTEYGIEGYTFQINDGKKGYIPRSSNHIGVDGFLASVVSLWTNIAVLARRGTVTDHYDQIQQLVTDGYDLKAAFQTRVYEERPYPASQDVSSLLSFPTSREVERIQAITPDLNTYSAELLTSLIMGEKSLDNWNSYISDLRRLGLDELISIYQARIDRGR
ncbi:MAG: extracellular solute-binding protein [Treponema sp.]|jgi:ABC-type glycerol-3-phosphate transport system substrate-binding protein|nr:extracellular solute-binding protein [Treponema sp.]